MFITPVAMTVILVATIVLMAQGQATYFAWNETMVSTDITPYTVLSHTSLPPPSFKATLTRVFSNFTSRITKILYIRLFTVVYGLA